MPIILSLLLICFIVFVLIILTKAGVAVQAIMLLLGAMISALLTGGVTAAGVSFIATPKIGVPFGIVVAIITFIGVIILGIMALFSRE